MRKHSDPKEQQRLRDLAFYRAALKKYDAAIDDLLSRNDFDEIVVYLPKFVAVQSTCRAKLKSLRARRSDRGSRRVRAADLGLGT